MLHHPVTQRKGSPSWRSCKRLGTRASLRHRIKLFEKLARDVRSGNELFAKNTGIQVMPGQGITPRQHHPVADLEGDAEHSGFLNSVQAKVDKTQQQWSAHQACVDRCCGAPKRAPAA